MPEASTSLERISPRFAESSGPTLTDDRNSCIVGSFRMSNPPLAVDLSLRYGILGQSCARGWNQLDPACFAFS